MKAQAPAPAAAPAPEAAPGEAPGGQPAAPAAPQRLVDGLRRATCISHTVALILSSCDKMAAMAEE